MKDRSGQPGGPHVRWEQDCHKCGTKAISPKLLHVNPALAFPFDHVILCIDRKLVDSLFVQCFSMTAPFAIEEKIRFETRFDSFVKNNVRSTTLFSTNESNLLI